MQMNKSIYLLGIAGAMNLNPGLVAAQSGKPGLEEIIVTAQRREENLQSTPVSVAAFSSDRLREMNATSLSEVTAFVPNFSIGNTVGQSTNRAAVSIRGVNEASGSITTSPAVGIYIDDVFYGQPQLSFLKLIDVERVEVLRGPQGTLFGRNNNGGAIRYITQKPTFDGVNGYVTTTVGDHDRFDVGGAINLPFGDTVALRFKAASLDGGGYVKRRSDNVDLGAENTTFASAQLRWKPSDRLDLNATVDHTFRDTDLGPQKLIDYYRFNNTTDFVPGPPGPAALAGPGASSSAGWNSRWGTTQRRYAPEIPASLYEVAGTGTMPRLKTEATGVTLNIAYSLSDSLVLRSISGFRKVDEYRIADPDDQASAPLFLGQVQTENSDFWSQELQISGTGERLNWTAGVYYSDTKPESQEISDGDGRGPSSYGVLQRLTTAEFENKHSGVFAQGTLNLTEELSVTAGLRWSQDDQTFTTSEIARWNFALAAEAAQLGLPPILVSTDPVNGPGPNCLNVNVTGTCVSGPQVSYSSKESSTTPRVAIEYQWSDSFMSYVSGSEGFKSGGPNDTPADIGITFAPEAVRTYELGFRTEWLDKRARINATYFFSEYEGKHLTVAPGTASAVNSSPCIGRCVLNAGDAEIDGVELETMFAVTDRLQLHANAATLDAKWTKVRPGAGVSLSSDFALAPEFSYNVGGSYRFPLASGSAISAIADYAYKDAQETNSADSTTLTVPEYDLLTFRLKYTSRDGAWDASIFCTNCADEEYIVGGNIWAGSTANTIYPYKPLDHPAYVSGGVSPNQVTGPDIGYVIVGPPRMLGIDFRYNF